MTEIKPCPFCGEFPSIIYNPGFSIWDYSGYVILCKQHTRCFYGDTKKEAIETWNQRFESGDTPEENYK